MKLVSKSISVLPVLILLAFPFSANAQSGITTLPDFNGDGMSDLLWNNPTNGQTMAWFMDGTSIVSSVALLGDPAWKIIKTADLDGDRRTDLIVYNESTGQTVAWILSGTAVTSWTVLPAAPGWKVTEAADLNGDGKTDLLLYNASNGQTAAWLMNGPTTSSWTVLNTDADWQVLATADLNGDRTADLIWNNTSTGQTAAWLMNGTSPMTSTVLLTASNWKVIAAADFNGDRMADLLWHNVSNGMTSVWLMNGTSTINWTVLPSDSNWKVAATADLNGDGKADIILSNSTTGQKVAWLMNGTSVSGSAALLTSFNWSLSAAADLNNDGKADLLWYNSSTGQTAAWLMSGTSPTNGANLFTDSSWRLKCIKGTSITAGIACDDSAVLAATGIMPVNLAPIVNAGVDQSITLPAIANLAGSSSDDGVPIALQISTWSQVSGPAGGVTFGNASSLTTTANFPAAGMYTLRLTVSDSSLTSTDDVIITVASPPNQAPVVNAGPDQIITFPAAVNLIGTATDDGLPNGNSLSMAWIKLSGPGTVAIANANSLNASATFSAAGTYTLRLTVSDGSSSASDDIVIVVNPAPTNQAPSANAGSDKSIVLPASLTLIGTGTDDGLPNGSTLTVNWSKISGPGTVTFVNANSLSASATFSAAGTYTLRLTVSDGSLSASDDMIVTASAQQSCGDMVSGTLTLTANATDNVGVVGVQLKLDGVNLGAELTTAPYSIPWNTTVTLNGCHTLSAVARDAAGNQGSTSLQVTVLNALVQQEIVLPTEKSRTKAR